MVGYSPWGCKESDTTERLHLYIYMGFPGGSDGKESACSAGDLGLIPGLGRSPGEGNRSPRPYYCLENSMDRGAWQATVHGVAKRTEELTLSFHLAYAME